MCFLAMLAGPFYTIIQIASERENARLAPNLPGFEAFKINVSSTALTVSSNFEFLAVFSSSMLSQGDHGLHPLFLYLSLCIWYSVLMQIFYCSERPIKIPVWGLYAGRHQEFS